jgi:hypothetical protein
VEPEREASAAMANGYQVYRRIYPALREISDRTRRASTN